MRCCAGCCTSCTAGRESGAYTDEPRKGWSCGTGVTGPGPSARASSREGSRASGRRCCSLVDVALNPLLNLGPALLDIVTPAGTICAATIYVAGDVTASTVEAAVVDGDDTVVESFTAAVGAFVDGRTETTLSLTSTQTDNLAGRQLAWRYDLVTAGEPRRLIAGRFLARRGWDVG